jgi:hypothetical protein
MKGTQTVAERRAGSATSSRRGFDREHDQVKTWPAETRIALARRVLEAFEAAQKPPRPERGYSAEEVISRLKMPQPAPNDAECQQILEEESARKHGA